MIISRQKSDTPRSKYRLLGVGWLSHHNGIRRRPWQRRAEEVLTK